MKTKLLFGNSTGHGWRNVLKFQDGMYFYGHCCKDWSYEQMAENCNEPRTKEQVERGWKTGEKNWIEI